MLVSCESGALLVNGTNPTGSSVPCSAISSLVINGGGGDDVIDILGVAGSTVKGVVVDGGDGNDRIGSSGFTTGNTGLVQVTGGAGDDVVIGTSTDVLKGGPGNDTMSRAR